MITPSKVIDIAYSVINQSPIKTAMTGCLYKIDRPLNQSTEDIIINALSVSNEAVQQGIINVNLHVPNLVLGDGGVQDNTRADFARLDELSTIFAPTMDQLFTSGVFFEVQNINIFPEENIAEHFVNFRIIFYSKNVN